MPEPAPSRSPSAAWQPTTQQRVFRQLLTCFAHPGHIAVLDDGDARMQVLATLLDGETTLADPHGLIATADWARLEARRAAPDRAAFVVADGAHAPEFAPQLGSLESPERGATLILAVAALGEGSVLRLSGPGIEDRAELAVRGWHRHWIRARADWVASFPLGVDIILCDGTRCAALPRTTRIEREPH